MITWAKARMGSLYRVQTELITLWKKDKTPHIRLVCDSSSLESQSQVAAPEASSGPSILVMAARMWPKVSC